MEKKQNQRKNDKSFSLLLSIILVFSIFGAVIFSVAQKISAEMSSSAIQNLSESLELMKGTIDAILLKEAEFQKLIADEIAEIGDPEQFIRTYNKNKTMVKMSLILSGEEEGISNTGETFTEEELDFSANWTIDGIPISKSYVNYMGTWAYTIKCPVEKDGREIASLYIEYVYDALDRSLPDGFYNGHAMLYIMDTQSERMVLKPKGMGERDAGHLNLEDFYRANNIQEEELQAEVAECIKKGDNILFYHDVQGKSALNYMWAVNDGSIYLIGYVPIEAIQQEGRTVNQNIIIVITVMLVAFFLCCLLYSINQRQQNKIRKEREAEREIHNQRLAEALQAAQIASNSKTTFLSNMSHDIRTPMNAVLGFTTLLAKDADDPVKVREYTKKITASGQHLLSLINDVLDVSKIESGKVVLTIDEFTLSDLVSSVDAIIRPMAQARGQSFHVEVSGIKHEYLMGDETRINQILINLLSNSVKYTPEGGSIWFRIIGLKQRSSQYEHIRIEVEDNGYGMTPEYLKTIFDAFTRAENSTTNKVQGTGLGMAITKNIVELMGGTIDVSSEVDKGSLFKVELEFRIPEGRADHQFWEKNGIAGMLVVDGDAKTAESIQVLMKDTGIRVDTVFDAEEAVRLIREESAEFTYDLILMDWNAAGMEGIRAAEKLREVLPDTVPLLFLASYDAEGIEEALHMKNTEMLAKPFFVSAFKEKILDMQTGRREDAPAETVEETTLEGLRFLAAEDNEINAEILVEILSIEGAECEVAENGRMAVERFTNAEAGEFDAILMDVQMPVMNGYDATRAIRSLAREDAADIPIIAMTANAFAEDEKEALDAGMNVHLAKPIDIDLLKEVIKQCIIKKGIVHEKE
ncbi:MAG: response regulator [Ruminococcus sp.]|uniref:Circadian input-output histidine kinase CikA n=2 Tax=Schaedlerella arabinosiphila TaxID=2044587 RepID=A0A3R8JU15_9FIRM|nr:response regulator [Schaedlerella arabinosiphila]MCI8723956.1 response regulator [Ruminococcus sp.]RRK35474.1 response regulator [Schaedlerella arabinosiphila]